MGLGAPAQAVHIADFDLDVTTLDSSYIGLDLEPGSYRASLRSGRSDAWSAWDTTDDNCTNDCLRGWMNFYFVFNVAEGAGGYVENGTFTPSDEYDFSARRTFSTPEAALAAAVPFQFVLSQPTLFFFWAQDCDECYSDNPGGLSFTLERVPEPGSLGLLMPGLAAACCMQVFATIPDGCTELFEQEFEAFLEVRPAGAGISARSLHASTGHGRRFETTTRWQPVRSSDCRSGTRLGT